MLLVNFGIIV